MLTFRYLSRFFLVFAILTMLFSPSLSAAARNPNADNTRKLDNTAPIVTITSPADNASFLKGAVVTLTATASDAQDGVLSSRITWKSSINGTTSQIGGSISTANLSVGTHTITAAVTDSGGLSGSDKITITVTAPETAPVVNTAPIVTITSPADNASFLKGAVVTLTATASDAQDGVLSSRITWKSSINGTTSQIGGSISTANLSVGTHTITAAVTDSGGLSGSDKITITVVAPETAPVVNTAPAVNITSPADSASFIKGDSISFKGTASDTQEGDLTSEIDWSSSVSGSFGSGGSVSNASLSAGTHIITATATDNKGLFGTAQGTITVTAPVEEPVVNTAPAVTITSPADSASFIKGASISFKGTASDTQEGDLTSKIAWSSSVSGPFGSGGSVSNASLSAGTHTITAAVTDSKGLTGSSQVTIVVAASLVEGTSCSDLGMIPNDGTKGSSNYNILLAAAKKGTKINVDGIYYLQSSTSSNLVNNLYITGASKETSKLILLGGAFFTLNGTAVVENISIECPTNTASYFIRMTAPFINDITIRNNYITGNIRLIASSTGDNYNFTSNTCYIKNLVIDNNEFYDLYSSTSTKIIIYTGDTPVKSCYITNNKVTNFSYIFYHNGITNGHAYADYLYKNNNAVIKNNIVKCTDDYNAVARNNGTIHAYYTFSLIEGNSVECSNNTFEGFHVSDAPNTVVYDNYLSVIKLLYENNTWKNIVNFTAGIADVDIMKSKTAYDCGIKRERIYRGNTYIIEPGYADRFGEDRYLLRKEINSLTSEVDDIIVEDNYFDVYILSFRYWGLKFYEDLYKFSGNTILMDTVEHDGVNQAMVYVGDMKDSSGNPIPRNAIFTNNKIICDTKPFGSGVGTEKFSLINNASTSSDKTTVDFSGNEIRYPDYTMNLSNITSQVKNGTIVNFNNNIINGAVY